MIRRRWRDASEFSDDEDFDTFAFENEARRRLNAYKIKRIKHNHPDSKCISFVRELFSQRAWERLGGYISRNNHIIECMSLRQCNLNNTNLSAFLNGKKTSKDISRIKVLSLCNNSFGSGGIRSLVPFLTHNAFNLTSLNVSGNDIGTEGFWYLMKGLDGGLIEKLNVRHCGLTNIAILESVSLFNLQVLYLSDNVSLNVKPIAEFLRRGDSKLKKLYVNRCNIQDDGAATISESLVKNNSLIHLELESNDIRGRGLLALLKLVTDISSVETTHKSNHLLSLIGLKGNADTQCNGYIEHAIKINQCHVGDPIGAGRSKVIKYHLISNTRMILSELHGVGNYFMRPFVSLDAAVLPDVLAVVGQESGLSDMYRLLLARNSDLGFSVYGT